VTDPNRAAQKAAKLAAKQAAHQEAVAGLEFHEWPKIGRLNRDVVITEKIDGTNAAIGIVVRDEIDASGSLYRVYAQSRSRVISVHDDNYGFAAWVERNKDQLILALGPGLHFGEWWGVGIARGYGMSERRFSLFNTAKWGAGEGATALVLARSEGVAIYAVPVLYSGPWTANLGYKNAETSEWFDFGVEAAKEGEPDVGDTRLRQERHEQWLATLGLGNPRPRFAPNFIMEWLARVGSQAAPGFASPEGVVVYHRAGNICMKATIEGDAEWKGKRDVLA